MRSCWERLSVFAACGTCTENRALVSAFGGRIRNCHGEGIMAFILGKKIGPEKQVTEAVAGKGDETVRISFRMDRSLHTRLKLEAVRQGRTIVSMLEGFVTEHTPTV